MTKINRIFLGIIALTVAGGAWSADAPDGKIKIEARKMYGRDIAHAEGDVEACFNGYLLKTEQLEYHRQNDELRAPYEFELHAPDNAGVLRGESLTYWPGQNTGEAENAVINMGESGLRATGEKLYFQNNLLIAQNASMTSCKGETPAWSVYAESTKQQGDKVDVNNAWLRAGGAKVMYFPRFRLYTSDRKRSGFLPPEVRYNSGEGGHFKQPYYVFLAENYDATITPEWFANHGFLVGGEFRYLVDDHLGNAELFWAPKDGGRGRQNFSHMWQSQHWRVHAFSDNVSDEDYFADFSEDSTLLAMRNLSRGGRAEYEHGDWRGQLAYESFKTINYTGTPPHDLAPQLQVSHHGGSGAYSWNSQWEYANFLANDPQQLSGQRWLWRAGASRRFGFGGAAVFPESGFHAVKYNDTSAENRDANSGINDDAAFITPYMRLRTELGDRPLPGGGSYQVRGVYAYAPETTQSDAPIYDTALRRFSAGGIYDWNRFVGGDRAADAHVAAYGADFRWRDAGRESLYLELAQRYYFRRPQVTLPDEGTPPEIGFANLLAALRGETGKWKIKGDAEWNPTDSQIESAYVDARADFGRGRLVRAGGVFGEDESVLLGGASPLGGTTEAAFLARYLLGDDRIAESEIALVTRGECGCWSLFVRAGNLITAKNDAKRSYSIGFELKGLGRAGNNGYQSIIGDLR